MSVSGFCAKVFYVVAVVVLHSFCAPALLLVIVTNSATQLLRREIYLRVYAFKYGTITSIDLCECDFGTLCSAGHTISLTGTSSFVVASFSSFWE